jgi:hypothetical protein
VAIRSVTESALSGIALESERFERSAAKVTRLAGAPSAAETAETVQISPEAREASANMEQGLGTGLESAMVDTRVAKYAFMASLKLLQTGAEVERVAAQIVEPRDE